MGISSDMFKFKFQYLEKLRMSANLSKSSGPRTPGMIGSKFKHLIELRVLTNPNHLVQGLQVWLDLSLNT